MGQATEKLKKIMATRGIQYINPRGSLKAPIWYIGEAGGEDEEAEGYAFVGAAGRQLMGQMRVAGIDPEFVCYNNPYKIRPPDNKLARLSERGIPTELFLEQFLEELYENKPPIIAALGATPLGILCPETAKKDRKTGSMKPPPIGKWRGSLLKSPHLPWDHYIIPIYHPAFVLRQYSERDIAIFCHARVKEEFDYYAVNGKTQPLPKRELIAEPSFGEVMDYLHECKTQKEPISVDIEMLRRRVPDLISLAQSPYRAMSFGLYEFETFQTVQVWRELDNVLRSHAIIGQNWLCFDQYWVHVLGFRPLIDRVEDTMIRHHVLWPELPHKLEFMVMQYTREPYFKDEGKGWTTRDSITKKKIYNCKDSTTTYEIFLEQDKEFDEQPNKRRFYHEYEKHLYRKMHHVERRGIKMDEAGLDSLRNYIITKRNKVRDRMEVTIGGKVALNKEEAELIPNSVNIGSPRQLIEVFKKLGIPVPRKRGTGAETTEEAYIQQVFADTGHDFIKDLLTVREHTKMLGTYVNAKLVDNVLYSSYVTAGTETGRRSARKTPLNYGVNHQNIPKHSKLAKSFRDCMIARPGKILLQADQAQAEDWVTTGLIADISGVHMSLQELLDGINRHQKLASFIFSKPLGECTRGTSEYFLGKKTRHAGHYDMYGNTMSLSMAKEGFSVDEAFCTWVLERFHESEPMIRGVFHKYIQEQINEHRKLVSLLGRERDFLGLRPYGDNGAIFRKGYAFIPQSTVGDNTGMAILYCEEHEPGLVIIDGHDAVTLEVDDTLEAVTNGVRLLTEAFNRELTFPNGLKIKIPIEFELGYTGRTVECEDLTEVGLMNTLNSLRQQASLRKTTISGVP